MFRIQKASELSGVSEELIRAWERRHNVLEPERTPSGQRLYTDVDIEVLRRLRRLTEDGINIGQAALQVEALRREVVREVQGAAAPAQGIPQLEHWLGLVMQAARSWDPATIELVLDEAFSSVSPVRVFDALIAPSLRAVGDAWHAGELRVAQEHLATGVLRNRVISALHGSPGKGTADVVVACAPDEQHEVGALGAALRLRAAGSRVVYLGQRVPVAELVAAAKALTPRAVAVSAVVPVSAEVLDGWLAELAAGLPGGVRVVVGGGGVEGLSDVCQRHGAVCFEAGGWTEVLGEVFG